MHPFTPTGDTVNVAAISTTGNVALGTFSGSAGASVRVYNAGTATVFIAFGISTVEAVAATSMPVPAGAIEVFAVGPGVTHMAAITASSTATVYATPGQGI